MRGLPHTEACLQLACAKCAGELLHRAVQGHTLVGWFCCCNGSRPHEGVSGTPCQQKTAAQHLMYLFINQHAMRSPPVLFTHVLLVWVLCDWVLFLCTFCYLVAILLLLGHVTRNWAHGGSCPVASAPCEPHKALVLHGAQGAPLLPVATVLVRVRRHGHHTNWFCAGTRMGMHGMRMRTSGVEAFTREERRSHIGRHRFGRAGQC